MTLKGQIALGAPIRKIVVEFSGVRDPPTASIRPWLRVGMGGFLGRWVVILLLMIEVLHDLIYQTWELWQYNVLYICIYIYVYVSIYVYIYYGHAGFMSPAV